MKDEDRLRAQMDRFTQERQALTSKLSRIGFIWPGSITKRRLTCGTSACACHTNPSALHGPYTYWTTKKKGKTVGKLLKDEQAELIQEWVENRKQLDALLKRLYRLSKRAFGPALRIKVVQRRQRKDRPRPKP